MRKRKPTRYPDAGTACLDLCQELREKATVVEEFNRQDAALIRKIVDQFEEAVMYSIPEWWTLGMVQRSKPWSMKWLRRQCANLQGSGGARKTENGRWEMHCDVVLAMPKPPTPSQEIMVPDDEEEMNELARQLAMED